MKTTKSGAAMCAVSLFSGGGLGDFAIENGLRIPVIASCELLPDRASLLRENYPDTRVFEGDIYENIDDIVTCSQIRLNKKRPWLVVLSPPCQGMSSNGLGRINKAKTQGKRPQTDVRNRLLLPGLEVATKLQPDVILFENVAGMVRAEIEVEGVQKKLLSIISENLDSEYIVKACVMQVADYGVPHRRERLITIAVRKNVCPCVQDGIILCNTSILHATPTHKAHITINRSIGDLEELDALKYRQSQTDALHRVPKWTDWQYFCMKHTPEGKTAFDNMTCIVCNTAATNKADLFCVCGEALPRPRKLCKLWECDECNTTNKDKCCEKANHVATHKLIRAFKTSYKRMRSDGVASTLTTNSGVISSDVKGHPTQHRVLSLRELLILSSLQLCSENEKDVSWEKEYKVPESDTLLRHVVGEGIPPLFLYKLLAHLRVMTT